MAHTYPSVNTAADTFGNFVTKVNSIINSVATEVVTANGAANGAVTTGNTLFNGIFSANVLAIITTLRGGNVQSSATLNILSNVAINAAATFCIGNSTVNTYANSSYLDVITLEATSANLVSANMGVATVNTLSAISSVLVGNSTANISILPTAFVISNTVSIANLNPRQFNVGNTTVNATINSTALVFSNSSGTFSLDGSLTGGLSATEYNSRFKFANITLTGTSAQTIDSFQKDTYQSAEYLVTVMDNTANGFQTSKVLCSHAFDGTVAYSTEYAPLISNASLGLFSAVCNATHVLLQFTPTSSNCKVSFGRTAVNL